MRGEVVPKSHIAKPPVEYRSIVHGVGVPFVIHVYCMFSHMHCTFVCPHTVKTEQGINLTIYSIVGHNSIKPAINGIAYIIPKENIVLLCVAIYEIINVLRLFVNIMIYGWNLVKLSHCHIVI